MFILMLHRAGKGFPKDFPGISQGFPEGTMNMTPGYFHRKQKENKTKRIP